MQLLQDFLGLVEKLQYLSGTYSVVLIVGDETMVLTHFFHVFCICIFLHISLISFKKFIDASDFWWFLL